MGIRLQMKTAMAQAKHSLFGESARVHHGGHGHASSVSPAQRSNTRAGIPPKGHLAVYVGDVGDEYYKKRRFVVPISHLSHPLFQDLLKRAEEEYGFSHPMGGLTIPCTQNAFLQVSSLLNHKYH